MMGSEFDFRFQFKNNEYRICSYRLPVRIATMRLSQ